MKLLISLMFLVNICHLVQSLVQVAEGNITLEDEDSLREDMHPVSLKFKSDCFFVQSKYQISDKVYKFSPQIALCIENSVTKQLIENLIIPNAPPASFS
jgi:hypothetical protein